MEPPISADILPFARGVHATLGTAAAFGDAEFLRPNAQEVWRVAVHFRRCSTLARCISATLGVAVGHTVGID